MRREISRPIPSSGSGIVGRTARSRSWISLEELARLVDIDPDLVDHRVERRDVAQPVEHARRQDGVGPEQYRAGLGGEGARQDRAQRYFHERELPLATLGFG